MKLFETNPDVLKNVVNPTPNEVGSKSRKSKLLSLAIMIPTILWFFNGFFIAQEALSKSFGICVGTGLICALLVFMIEKTIANSTGRSKIIVFTRLLLATSVSIVGVVGLKLMIYGSDINQILQQKSIAKADSLGMLYETQNKDQKQRFIDDLQSRKTETQLIKDRLLEEYQGKPGSSRKPGDGSIARAIRFELNKAQKIENTADSTLKVIEKSFEEDKQKFVENSKIPWGIKEKLGVLNNIIFSDMFNILFFTALLLVLMMMDLIVVLIKYTEPLTQREILERHIYDNMNSIYQN